MHDNEDLLHLINSRTPIIVIESREEKEILKSIHKIGLSIRQHVYAWSLIRGFSVLNNHSEITGTNIPEPTEILLTIYNNRLPGIYILLDFHSYLANDRNLRLIKEIAQSAEKYSQTLIFISAQFDVPVSVKHFTAMFEAPLPSEDKIRLIINQLIAEWDAKNLQNKIRTDESIISLFIKHLKGLSASEIRRLMYNALRDNALTIDDIPEIAKAKYDLLNKDEVLYYEHNTSSFSQVGGQKNLKGWLEKRRNIFLGEKKFIMSDIPKGILLLGVQGSGKSLAAKSVAGTWGIPLLRMDFGTLYNKYYGETERKTRESLKMADLMSPCVLWIDEIEKGIGSDSGESGTSKRVLGTLLTWMAERTSRVFVVATANDIQFMPPELMRKGRLDEIFFVDLPDIETRKEIFSIHLKKRELDPNKFDLQNAAELSDGFSGAEIEQVIVSGLYSSIGGSGNLDTELLSDEIKKTKPLSVIMSEKIQNMREWANERTVPAN
jgi:SpoVK/Ycf46/Vps4 family AAA+-type ATPase